MHMRFTMLLSSIKVVALLLLAVTTTTSVNAQVIDAWIDVKIQKYFSLSQADLGLEGLQQITKMNSQQACMNRGGTLIQDYNLLAVTAATQACARIGTGKCATYTDGDATPSTTSQLCSREKKSTNQNDGDFPNSYRCMYRYRYGFFDMFASYLEYWSGPLSGQWYEPGTTFFYNLYPNNALNSDNQMANGYNSVKFNQTTIGRQLIYPRGYYFTAGFISGTSYGRIDVDEIPGNNDPYPLSQYFVLCSVQEYIQNPPPIVTGPPGVPQLVQGWKNLTWPQRYWWVIFIIPAVIVIILLLVILIFCCATSTKEDPGPSVAPMVMRERSGELYADDHRTT